MMSRIDLKVEVVACKRKRDDGGNGGKKVRKLASAGKKLNSKVRSLESLIILLGSSSHLLLSIMLERLIFKLRCWPAVCGTRQHGVGVIDCSDLVVTDIV
jgi:hypothetical protein